MTFSCQIWCHLMLYFVSRFNKYLDYQLKIFAVYWVLLLYTPNKRFIEVIYYQSLKQKGIAAIETGWPDAKFWLTSKCVGNPLREFEFGILRILIWSAAKLFQNRVLFQSRVYFFSNSQVTGKMTWEVSAEMENSQN